MSHQCTPHSQISAVWMFMQVSKKDLLKPGHSLGHWQPSSWWGPLRIIVQGACNTSGNSLFSSVVIGRFVCGCVCLWWGVWGLQEVLEHLHIYLYDGIRVHLWVWYLNSDEHWSLQRLTAHVISVEIKCSISLFFLKVYSAYRRENCKDISSWLPLHCRISAESLSSTTQQKHRGGVMEEKWWSPAGAVVWMFYRWNDEKEMKPDSTPMLILF